MQMLLFHSRGHIVPRKMERSTRRTNFTGVHTKVYGRILYAWFIIIFYLFDLAAHRIIGKRKIKLSTMNRCIYINIWCSGGHIFVYLWCDQWSLLAAAAAAAALVSSSNWMERRCMQHRAERVYTIVVHLIGVRLRAALLFTLNWLSDHLYWYQQGPATPSRNTKTR